MHFLQINPSFKFYHEPDAYPGLKLGKHTHFGPLTKMVPLPFFSKLSSIFVPINAKKEEK